MTTCAYCSKREVADGNIHSCSECVFECESCKKMTPFERGVSWDELCDDCGVAAEMVGGK